MKRRNFITSILGALATLPFLGWLKPEPDPYALNAAYTSNIVDAINANSGSTKITVEFMRKLHEHAQKIRIRPFTNSQGDNYYKLYFHEKSYDIYKDRLTPHPGITYTNSIFRL